MNKVTEFLKSKKRITNPRQESFGLQIRKSNLAVGDLQFSSNYWCGNKMGNSIK